MSPVDIKSPKQIGEFIKRIFKGPMTIVLVYADWCGHCHSMMPAFDKAAKTPGRNVQVVKINEKVLTPANSALTAKTGNSMDVSGYPTVLAISKNGENVVEMPARTEAELSRAMTGATGSTGSVGANIISESNTSNSSAEPSILNSMPSSVEPPSSAEDAATESAVNSIQDGGRRRRGRRGGGLYDTLRRMQGATRRRRGY